jgi:hypothetical protein
MSVPFDTLIRPAVDDIAERFGAYGGPAPAALMVAIGGQESKFQARDQLEMQNGVLVAGRPGPAMGFWQFEKNGGVAGVMTHPASRAAARYYADACGVEFDREKIWLELGKPSGDELAAAFARLLLLTDPQPLPMPRPENEQVAWEYYVRCWKPGKPHPEFWAANWKLGCDLANKAFPTGSVVNQAAPEQPPRTPTVEERLARLENIIANWPQPVAPPTPFTIMGR